MVAADLMCKVEEFFDKLAAGSDEVNTHARRPFNRAWLEAFGIIVYFQLPVHRDSGRRNGSSGC